MGYHVQSNNREDVLSMDLGMADWGIELQERFQKYREFVYETGALDTGKGATLDPKLVKKEREKGYRLRYRTRYFADSGIIGTKEFVASHAKKFHDHFACKGEKKPQKVEGLEGMFSLKRLSET
ncbi:MAG: hypothetical protein PHO79_02860 [Desulfoplanes sp.]|nr:hypothetical protein [Desulfoplanes sp.]MDD4648943.1 hypothetical protein [Desulfoplanes sp.]